MDELWHEWRYRRIVGGLTHEQYKEEPPIVVEALIRIDDMENALEVAAAEERRKEIEAAMRTARR